MGPKIYVRSRSSTGALALLDTEDVSAHSENYSGKLYGASQEEKKKGRNFSSSLSIYIIVYTTIQTHAVMYMAQTPDETKLYAVANKHLIEYTIDANGITYSRSASYYQPLLRTMATNTKVFAIFQFDYLQFDIDGNLDFVGHNLFDNYRKYCFLRLQCNASRVVCFVRSEMNTSRKHSQHTRPWL